MTWLWRTFSSGLSLAPLLAASVSGRVVLVDSLHPGVRKHKDYAGVVVWLEPAGHNAPLPPPATVTVAQKGKKFVPHITAIPVGGIVDFPNFDPVFHNAFSNFSGQPFDVGLYPPGSSQKVQFRREGVVHVFCNIHSSMSAVIVVLRTPYFAVSDQSGAFAVHGVPRGEYRLRVWHERAAAANLKALERKLAVEGSSVALPDLQISESGYLEIPHKNKYGQDYPPEPAGPYPPSGAR